MAEQLANEPTTSATTTATVPETSSATTAVGASDDTPAPKPRRAAERPRAKLRVRVKAKPASRPAVKLAEPKRTFLRGALRSPADERRRVSPVAPHPVVVPPIRKKKEKAPRPRLRILIAGDPKKPMRQISLPHALPVIVSAAAV